MRAVVAIPGEGELGTVLQRGREKTQELLVWDQGGGLIVDASVVIPDQDRKVLDRLIHRCTHPDFAHERLRHTASERKRRGEFVNTWSSGTFVGESIQLAATHATAT